MKVLRRFTQLVLPCLMVLALALSVAAQGKGKGGGGGRGSGGGNGNGGGPPSGVGVDRGSGNASERSKGKSDDGLDNASTKSKGRSDAGRDRARIASDNLRRADDDLRNHPGLPKALHTNANDLRAGYQSALGSNPNLNFGNYVSATRVAQNLGGRHPQITQGAILSGMSSGRSLGRTLQDLGLNERDAKDAEKRAKDEIKLAKKNK